MRDASKRALEISCTLLILAGGSRLTSAQSKHEFDAGKTGFTLEYRGATSSYRVTPLFVLPGEEVRFYAASANVDDVFRMDAERGTLRKTSKRGWAWSAPPGPGRSRLELTREGDGERIEVNAFVLVPVEKIENERLNGYRIGSYPGVPLRGLPIYRPPRGFVEVTPENENTLLTPHFRLRQFLCKQTGGYPKYVVLRERLLLKLEVVLESVNEKGINAETLHVMSGYRTPFYNQAIGNVKYSRHVWGGAADVFVDVDPRDGVMDDLNGDGKLDVQDAGVLYEWVDEAFARPLYATFVGGLARYKPTPAHGPFVHVDARGTRARWGN